MTDAPAKEVHTSTLSDTLVSIGGILVIVAITGAMFLVTVGL